MNFPRHWFPLAAGLLAALIALPSRSADAVAPSAAPLPPMVEPAPLYRAPPAAPATPAVPADPAQAFAAGVAAYDKGDFAAARAAFESAAKTAQSPALEYNLGNACFESGDHAAAILHYLRSLALDPRNPDARANLAFARQALGVVAPDPGARERMLAWMSVNAWTLVATLAGWSSAYLLFLPRLYRWRGAAPWLLFAVALAVTVLAKTVLWTALENSKDGVVLRDDTQMRIAPTAHGQPVGVLQAGEIARALERHGNYYRVAGPAGQTGWVSADNYAPVRD